MINQNKMEIAIWLSVIMSSERLRCLMKCVRSVFHVEAQHCVLAVNAVTSMEVLRHL